jgi:hypothetical protein
LTRGKLLTVIENPGFTKYWLMLTIGHGLVVVREELSVAFYFISYNAWHFLKDKSKTYKFLINSENTKCIQTRYEIHPNYYFNNYRVLIKSGNLSKLLDLYVMTFQPLLQDQLLFPCRNHQNCISSFLSKSNKNWFL